MAAIGYARVSTIGQTLDQQLEALAAAGCDRVFSEKGSGTRTDRPQLAAALDHLRPGDTLVVTRLDRLGRNFRHLIETVEGLEDRGVHFRSVLDGMDTSTPAGRLVVRFFAALAAFERELTAERTADTLATKRARGARIGRSQAVTPDRLDAARQLLATGEHSVTSAARTLGVGRSTLYRALQADGGS